MVPKTAARHRFERLVFERFDAPTGVARGLGLLARRRRPGRRARPAEEPDDRAVLGHRQRARRDRPGWRHRTDAHGARGSDGRRRPRRAGSSRPRRRRRAASSRRRIRRCARSGPTSAPAPAPGSASRARSRPTRRRPHRAARWAPRGCRPARAGSRTAGPGCGSPRRSGPSAEPRGDEQTVADRQDRRAEARIGEDRRIEGAQGRGVRVVRRDRPGARDPPAPQDVVGEDEGARARGGS